MITSKERELSSSMSAIREDQIEDKLLQTSNRPIFFVIAFTCRVKLTHDEVG